MGKHRGKNKYSNRRKQPSSLNIKDIPMARPVLNIVDAPATSERVIEPKPSRGETIKPVVHGGYRNSFQVVYSYTHFGKGARV